MAWAWAWAWAVRVEMWSAERVKVYTVPTREACRVSCRVFIKRKVLPSALALGEALRVPCACGSAKELYSSASFRCNTATGRVGCAGPPID